MLELFFVGKLGYALFQILSFSVICSLIFSFCSVQAIETLLVMYSVIHIRVFTPLRELPTHIIEVKNHYFNSTMVY